jgi:WG repeat protein
MKTLAFLVLFLCQLTVAQEVYVKNRPFQGQTEGSAGDMYVEAKAFAEALEISLEEKDGGLILGDPGSGEPSTGRALINGVLIEARPAAAGVWMLPLKASVEALGGKYKYSRELQTIDVYLDPTLTTTASQGTTAAGTVSAPANLSGLRVEGDRDIEEYGYQDYTGRWVIPVQFKTAKTFSEGLAAVQEAVGSPKKETRDVVQGSGSGPVIVMRKVGTRDVMVRKGGKWGFIDGRGQYVIEPRYTRAESFKDGAARVWQGKKTFWIDKNGTRLPRPPAPNR